MTNKIDELIERLDRCIYRNNDGDVSMERSWTRLYIEQFLADQLRAEQGLLEKCLREGMILKFNKPHIEFRYSELDGFVIDTYGDEGMKVLTTLIDTYEELSQHLSSITDMEV